MNLYCTLTCCCFIVGSLLEIGRGDKTEDLGEAEREMQSDAYNLVWDMESDAHTEAVEIYLWASAGLLVALRFVG